MVDVIVSGHLCLDLLPDMRRASPSDLAVPGRMVDVGPMQVATGGAVSNTGIALHRLGVDVGLHATVGDDLIGHLILDHVRSQVGERADMIVVRPGLASSYTIVLAPGTSDRLFLHCTGNNAAFTASDVTVSSLRGAKIFHLGYPPLLPKLIENDGRGLAQVFQTARKAGAITSLDTTFPDLTTEAGTADWPRILRGALKHVDIFVPSLEESLYMLRGADFARWSGHPSHSVTYAYLDAFADELLAMGPAVVGFKLGELGVFLKTAPDDRFDRMRPGGLRFENWQDKCVYQPAYQVSVAGTTGAGDAAYAALLAAALRGLSIDEAARWSCAVGACCCEALDAVSGVRSWTDTAARISAGWPHRPERLAGTPD
ncbi:MAG: carbohydrate kinase family protein [Chloroflexi bacterium]|nr:carbohydrate kinase family protein [Chloroflexota bacterium]